MFRVLWSGLLSCAVLGLAACGGSGGGDPEEGEVVVVMPTGETGGSGQTDTGGQTDTDSGDVFPEITMPENLAIGAVSTGSVSEREDVVYRVPPGAQIILTTQTGDADLFLYSSLEPSQETFLCAASRPYIEDVCTAPNDVDEVYAFVFGREASTYNIGVSGDCSVAAVNDWVYRNMKDYYLFADRVPDLDPSTYTSSADLIRDLRFEELDPYSSVIEASTQQAFQEEGTSFGLGMGFRTDADDNLRIAIVYEDSTAGRGGVRRGDILLGLNNELLQDLSIERIDELLGTRENPLAVSWQFIDGETGEAKSITLQEGEYRQNTVIRDTVYSTPAFDGVVGYILFDGFIRTSEAELDNAINRIKAEGATELVLDMRYNPGGLTSIAAKLAAQIGGADLDGNLLVRYEYNSKYRSSDFEEFFAPATPELNFDRVVVLTTGASASSAELVINALSPYIDVVVIGEKTEGKAFISRSNRFCGRSLNAMEAQGVNANNVSVAGGIEPLCYAEDDLTRDFGGGMGNIEGMLLSALNYVGFGTCEVAPAALAKKPVFKNTRINERLDKRQILGAVADQRRHSTRK